jgi:GNAT superfamily N-acetyltransferase
VIRDASRDDIGLILQLIHELAVYERAPDAVEATEELLRDALFGPGAVASALIAEHDGTPAGFALWFRSFSTWTGRPGLYLEDLFVRPEHRGAGHGRALLAELARRCLAMGGARLEWSVLDWNEPAIGFYRSLGATAMAEWTVHRLTGDALLDLAGVRAGED